MELKNLTQGDTDSLAEYIQSCELTKKNTETYKKSYNTCVEREANSGESIYLVAGLAVLMFVGGFVAGSQSH